MNGSSLRYRGFLLIEILGAIVLLSAFALIAAPFFSETMHVIERAPAEQDAITRFESVSEALRVDAWGAASFTSSGPSKIEMESPGQPSIVWRIDGKGDIERTRGSEQQRWIGVGKEAVLDIDGASVIFRSTSVSARDADKVRCVSLLQLARLRGDGK